MTLRTRFALWTSALTLVALAVFGSFVYLIVSSWLSASLDDSLRLSATQLVASSDIDHGKLDVADNPVTLNVALTEELRSQGFTIQLFSTSGSMVQSLGSHSALGIDSSDLAAALAGRTSTTTREDPGGGEQVRVHVEPITTDGRVIAVAQVSQSLATVTSLRESLLMALLLGSPIVVALAGVGGYLLARRALAPIDEITRAARRISVEDLSGRLELPSTRDEVGRLAATFDEMLARLDGAFRRERRFTNDAAHELRTPLAAMQTILGVTRQRRRTGPEYEAALDDLAEETARLSTLTEDLLRLARAESSLRPTDTVDLSTLLSDVVESMRPAAEAKHLSLSCRVDGAPQLVGDADALARLFVNLVDNAIKYTSGGSVEVTALANSENVRVAVRDTGDGVAAEHLPRLFERFYRADASRAGEGTGLGLAICAEIAEAHGGTIAVTSEPGGGSTFTVTLPRTSVASNPPADVDGVGRTPPPHS
jgi:heavy metal sensor kinase